MAKENAEYQKMIKELKERHAWMCTFWGIEKNDECNEKSEDFFKIF